MAIGPLYDVKWPKAGDRHAGVGKPIHKALEVVAIPLVSTLGAVLLAPIEILIKDFLDQRGRGRERRGGLNAAPLGHQLVVESDSLPLLRVQLDLPLADLDVPAITCGTAKERLWELRHD